MNTSNTRNTTSTPSAADARALLDRADGVSRQAASFSLAWLSYIALCAGGAVTAAASPTRTSPTPTRSPRGSPA